MAIETAGRRYRTLNDDVFVDDKKVYRVNVNGNKVYPEESDGSYTPIKGEGKYALLFGHLAYNRSHTHSDENSTYNITRYKPNVVRTAYEVRHNHTGSYRFSLGFVSSVKVPDARDDKLSILYAGGHGVPVYPNGLEYLDDGSVRPDYSGYQSDGSDHASFCALEELYYNKDLNLAYSVVHNHRIDQGTVPMYSFEDADAPLINYNGYRFRGYPCVGYFDKGIQIGPRIDLVGNKYEYETSGPDTCGPVYARIEEVWSYPPAVISYYRHTTAVCGDFYDIAPCYFYDLFNSAEYSTFALYGKTDVTCTIVNRGDVNSEFVRHHTQPLLVAAASTTDVLYIGDDPSMASIDRVEIVKSGNDYTYRLLD